MKENIIETPHIIAKKSEFAKTVIMPGDPLRSQYIAEKFLKNPRLINDVRGVHGYTGTYKGKKISVMAHGMGMPSMSIYAFELFNIFDVNNIIRVGTCGGLTTDMKVRDVVLASFASTPSNIGKHIYKDLKKVEADPDLLLTAKSVIEEKKKNCHISGVVTSDVFDYYGKLETKKYIKRGCTAVEMEVYALYISAIKANKHALAFLTVSDNKLLDANTTASERESSFDEMIELALDTAIKLK